MPFLPIYSQDENGVVVISLKKHIDGWKGPASETELVAYRSLLLGVAESSHRAVPDLGRDLAQKLAVLDEGLTGEVAAEKLAKTNEGVIAELAQWAGEANDRHQDNERQLKEVIAVMTRAIESVGERDERYAREVADLTARLRSITEITSLSAIRKCIVESANGLTECVERIAKDSRESLRRLSAQVDEYRVKLDKSEMLSWQDPLTGLANRRRFEHELTAKIKAGIAFSLILIDLNDFKSVNDKFGHLAGDELLKQFAEELRSQFRLADLVTRWGGDEFAVIIPTSEKDALARVHRIRRWLLGEYKLKVGHQTATVAAEASIGVVEWNRRESGPELLARADECMYQCKQSTRTRGSVALTSQGGGKQLVK